MLRKKKSTAGTVVRTVILIILLILIAVYVAGVFYFRTHYFLHTQINSKDRSFLTAEDLILKNEASASDYILTISDREGEKFRIKGTDISYEYQSEGEEQTIIENQNEFLWPLCLLSDYYYILHGSCTFDESALESVLDDLTLFSDTYESEPENAYVLLTADGYEVVQETMGNTLDKTAAAAAIQDAITAQKTYYEIPDDLYEQPMICSDDPEITALTDQLDHYLNAEITYDVGDQEEKVDRTCIASFLTINEDYTVALNETRITSYVDSLASKYNTFGDERQFKTNKGDTITIGGGDYGWVISKSKEKAEIIKDLESGEPTEREPMWEQTAVQLGTDDIGDTYIEIDYTAQHMWYYVDGAVKLETDIVSGNINKQNGSVDGIYKVNYKEKDATLVGEGYSSDVKYFMPFAYNIGFHDASWRSQFGGTIYKTDGSHGCVNMPADQAKKLFEMVEVGTPVIAYYREKVTLTNNAAKQSQAYSYKAE